jgi:dolichol kinase
MRVLAGCYLGLCEYHSSALRHLRIVNNEACPLLQLLIFDLRRSTADYYNAGEFTFGGRLCYAIKFNMKLYIAAAVIFITLLVSALAAVVGRCLRMCFAHTDQTLLACEPIRVWRNALPDSSDDIRVLC